MESLGYSYFFHCASTAVKRQSKGTKRKTRQAKALENAKKAPRTFHELLHEVQYMTICIFTLFGLHAAFWV